MPHPEAEGASGRTETKISATLLEEWALSYLGRYASSADNLRQVLRRRARRRTGRNDEGADTAGLIETLVARCREAGLVDDRAYAAGRARRGLARGRSLRRIAAGLAAKGVSAADGAAALAALREDAPDPELAAACVFARRRRLGPFRLGTESHEPAVELAAFARAGFGRRTAEAVLACTDESAVAALLADTGRGT